MAIFYSFLTLGTPTTVSVLLDLNIVLPLITDLEGGTQSIHFTFVNFSVHFLGTG